jgi:hypothetical protein
MKIINELIVEDTFEETLKLIVENHSSKEFIYLTLNGKTVIVNAQLLTKAIENAVNHA